ncbi:MAG: helix-turn-helix transcriptional regulator [Clostridia bacterium]|nr:helix-turn-helix transcriptional regulator [Clostridia bacterium]
MYNRLKELRENYNLTQSQISKFLNITSPQYCLYETGKRPIPILLLSKLAKFYNTSIDYIVGDTDEIIPYRK